MSYFVGVDPGLEGGVVALDEQGRVSLLGVMPKTPEGRIDSHALNLMTCALPFGTPLAVEKVWAMPKQGVVSMFTFGRVTGHAIGALEVTLGTTAVEIAPQTWQKGTFGRADDPKAAARAYVAEHFPGVNLNYSKTSGQPSTRVKGPHPGLVDALCLANFARLNAHLFEKANV